MSTTKRILQVFAIMLTTSLLAVLFVPFATRSMSAASSGVNYYVSASGNDSNNGTAAGTAFKTIQKAVDLAQAGDVINLASGAYMQDIISKRNGASDAPITITGPADAVVKGAGNGRIFEINHDNITLKGFTIDGLAGNSGSDSGYRDKLLYVLGKQARDGVSGLKVLNMTFKNGGGECVRLRYFARNNEIANSTFQNCGVHDYKFGAGGKNGEAIYIGTAPEQRSDGKNPTSDPDLSNDNWIHHNTFNTQGNECVDIKESATGNIVEYNTCTGQKDTESAGFDSRGNGNIFRYNESYGNLGAGVRLGGDTESDGLDNDVYGNNIHDNQAGGIKFQRYPQGDVCGNTMANNNGGNAVGSYASKVNPTTACANTPPPSATTTAVPQPTKTTVPPTSTSVPPTSTSVPPTATKTTVPPTSTSVPPTKTTVPPTSTSVPQPTKTAVLQPTATVPPQPTVPAPSMGNPLVYMPVLDTYIKSSEPDENYVEVKGLMSDLTPETWTLLRFEQRTGGPARRAILRLYVSNKSNNGGDVYVVSTNWDGAVTWNRRPALGTKLAEIGKVSKGKWITIDVTAALQADSVVTLAIVPRSKDMAGYRSTEHGQKYAPQLIVER